MLLLLGAELKWRRTQVPHGHNVSTKLFSTLPYSGVKSQSPLVSICQAKLNPRSESKRDSCRTKEQTWRGVMPAQTERSAKGGAVTLPAGDRDR